MHDAFITLVVSAIGGLVWLVRLEGRVNLIERVVKDFIDDQKVALSNVVGHMARIEEKMDKLTMRCIAYNHAMAQKKADDDAGG
jgi:hypothetical protein